MREVIHVDTTILGDLIDNKAETCGDLLIASYGREDGEDLILVFIGESIPAIVKDGESLALYVLGYLVRETLDDLEEVVINIDNLRYGGDEDLLVRYDGMNIVRVVLLNGLKKDERGMM